MKEPKIDIDPERCAGCLRCQLACSFLYTGAFNPAAARISIVASDSGRSISFTDECTACAACADECLFNALVRRAKRGTR
jgi:carbon-monoxide dehydrogenase iron sulfur subunit